VCFISVVPIGSLGSKEPASTSHLPSPTHMRFFEPFVWVVITFFWRPWCFVKPFVFWVFPVEKWDGYGYGPIIIENYIIIDIILVDEQLTIFIVAF
jgi:hypothetical protein